MYIDVVLMHSHDKQFAFKVLYFDQSGNVHLILHLLTSQALI